MTVTVRAAPMRVIGSAAENLGFSIQDAMSQIRFMDCTPQPNCSVPLKIGVFFDGTNNNRNRDEPKRCHSNIVRLFNAHKAFDAEGALKEQGHYRIYVPGVGTRFEENEEWRETMEGKSMGKGSQARILFALLRVFNAVHQSFADNQPLLQFDEITAKLREYTRFVDDNLPLEDNAQSHQQRTTRQSWLRDLNTELNQRLSRNRSYAPLPTIPEIRVNVFGFSRGAAQARAFCYWLNDALVGGCIAGMPVKVGFLGLFESVASVGLADSVRRTLGFFFADGHFAWAREIRGDLPAIVEETLHMVAGHEQRLNFPLTRASGSNVTEVIYPGVHSDVGGGYNPRDQGRAITEGHLLSQIPLMHMHRAARLAGTPFADWLLMDDRVRRDFEISPDLSSRWNHYMKAAEDNWLRLAKEGAPAMGESSDFKALMRQHMLMLYSFRRRYAVEISMTALCYALDISAQDMEDIVSYNRRLVGDLALLRERRDMLARGGFPGNNGNETFQLSSTPFIYINAAREAVTNLLPRHMATMHRGKEDDAIDWALSQFDSDVVGHEDHMPFLAQHVHDSLAGFLLIGLLTDEDKAEKLLSIVREGRSGGADALEPYQRQVFENFNVAAEKDEALKEMIERRLNTERRIRASGSDPQERKKQLDAHSKDSVFKANEHLLALPLFPLQTDKDASTLPDGIENLARLVTSTRREGGGYFMPRAVFD